MRFDDFKERGSVESLNADSSSVTKTSVSSVTRAVFLLIETCDYSCWDGNTQHAGLLNKDILVRDHTEEFGDF